MYIVNGFAFLSNNYTIRESFVHYYLFLFLQNILIFRLENSWIDYLISQPSKESNYNTYITIIYCVLSYLKNLNMSSYTGKYMKYG